MTRYALSICPQCGRRSDEPARADCKCSLRAATDPAQGELTPALAAEQTLRIVNGGGE